MTKKEALSILQPKANTEEALKQAYRAAALKYHPDHGGDVRLMQLVNLAYETLKGAWWTPYEKRAAGRETPLTEAMKKVWNQIAGFPGIQGEVCGTWLWVTGQTWRYKKQLKEAGFGWAPKKSAWYWHAGGYRKRSKKEISLDKIRETYGSENLSKEEKSTIAA